MGTECSAWKLRLVKPIISDNIELLCDTSVTTCPDEGNDYPLNGPNGIEIDYVPDKFNQELVVAISSSKLSTIRIGSASSISDILPSDAVTTSYLIPDQCFIDPVDAIQGIDGIIFDKEKDILYMAGRGTEGSIMVATRVDGIGQQWIVHAAYSASCVNDGTTAVAIANDNDVLVYCSNNFGSAPYNVSILRDVVNTKPMIAKTWTTITQNYDSVWIQPEGIEYDINKGQIIVGSTNGNLTGTKALYTNTQTVDYSDMYFYAPASKDQYGLVGLQLDPYDDKHCHLFGAVSNTAELVPGLAYFNICASEMRSLVYLTPCEQCGTDVLLFNDLAVLNNFVYISESYMNKIWKVTNPSTDHATFSVYVEASRDSAACDFINGMETYQERYLIWSCFNYGGLQRYDTKKDTKKWDGTFGSTGTAWVTIQELSYLTFYNVDGIIFNADKSILYASVFNYGRILALSSNDDWLSCDLLYIFQTKPASSTLALDLANNLYSINVNGFGPPPYSVSLVASVDSVVTNGNSVYGDSNTNSDSNNDDNSVLSEDGLLGAVIALAILSFGLIFYVVYSCMVNKNLSSDKAQLSSSL